MCLGKKKEKGKLNIRCKYIVLKYGWTVYKENPWLRGRVSQ